MSSGARRGILRQNSSYSSFVGGVSGGGTPRSFSSEGGAGAPPEAVDRPGDRLVMETHDDIVAAISRSESLSDIVVATINDGADGGASGSSSRGEGPLEVHPTRPVLFRDSNEGGGDHGGSVGSGSVRELRGRHAASGSSGGVDDEEEKSRLRGAASEGRVRGVGGGALSALSSSMHKAFGSQLRDDDMKNLASGAALPGTVLGGHEPETQQSRGVPAEEAQKTTFETLDTLKTDITPLATPDVSKHGTNEAWLFIGQQERSRVAAAAAAAELDQPLRMRVEDVEAELRKPSNDTSTIGSESKSTGDSAGAPETRYMPASNRRSGIVFSDAGSVHNGTAFSGGPSLPANLASNRRSGMVFSEAGSVHNGTAFSGGGSLRGGNVFGHPTDRSEMRRTPSVVSFVDHHQVHNIGSVQELVKEKNVAFKRSASSSMLSTMKAEIHSFMLMCGLRKDKCKVNASLKEARKHMITNLDNTTAINDNRRAWETRDISLRRGSAYEGRGAEDSVRSSPSVIQHPPSSRDEVPKLTPEQLRSLGLEKFTQ